MTKVTLTQREFIKFCEDNPTIPPEHCTGILLQQKGIKFKPTFGVLTEEHIIPPWKVHRNIETDTLYVTQGE